MQETTQANEIKTKECPFCAETINISAKKCKHCSEILDPVLRKQQELASAPPVINNISTSVSQTSQVKQKGSRNYGRSFPHIIHLILTLITGGFWLIIWILHYLFRGPQYR